MSVNFDTLKEQFDKADFMSKMTITFAACVRQICESGLCDDIKADAMLLAMRYYRLNTEIDFIEKVLDANKKTDAPLDVIFAAIAFELLDRSSSTEKKLRNMMELF